MTVLNFKFLENLIMTNYGDASAEINMLASLRDNGLISQDEFLKYLDFLIQHNYKELICLTVFSKEDLINYIYEDSDEDEINELVNYFNNLGYDLDNKIDLELLFKEITSHFNDPYKILDELIKDNKIKNK